MNPFYYGQVTRLLPTRTNIEKRRAETAANPVKTFPKYKATKRAAIRRGTTLRRKANDTEMFSLEGTKAK